MTSPSAWCNWWLLCFGFAGLGHTTELLGSVGSAASDSQHLNEVGEQLRVHGKVGGHRGAISSRHAALRRPSHQTPPGRIDVRVGVGQEGGALHVEETVQLVDDRAVADVGDAGRGDESGHAWLLDVHLMNGGFEVLGAWLTGPGIESSDGGEAFAVVAGVDEDLGVTFGVAQRVECALSSSPASSALSSEPWAARCTPGPIDVADDLVV